MLLAHLLKRFITNGRLTVTDHDGSVHTFGSGENGPSVAIRFNDAKVSRDLFFNPELKAAEAYMDGRIIFEGGSTAHQLLELFSQNRRKLGQHPVQKVLRCVWRKLRAFQQANAQRKAAANAHAHYDNPSEFYAMWLDKSMAYSCAYFQRPDMTLDEAQEAKFRHIAAKLQIKPGHRVLDIGSGWGALAIYLAKNCGAEVVGINVAKEQLAASRERAAAAGVAIEFVEADYRVFTGKFDRVVSVGMMEHVGAPHFDAYFRTVRNLLAPGGVALIHAIGRMAPPSSTSPFIRKYIFPGGYVPSLSEVFASTERCKLWVCDCETLRLHYYWTIKAWRERFEARRADVVAMMGERFTRMWEFYLSAVEFSFLTGGNMVFQLLLSETRDAVPVTRDYVQDEEKRLAEGAQVPA